jgi:predicted CXXCH cytochrome family protein
MYRNLKLYFPVVIVLLALALAVGTEAQPVSDIANTRHNLSLSGSGEVRATGQSEMCVFCHTPHSSNTSAAAPLWNRNLSEATYTSYDSSSIQALDIAEPIGSSRLCLSCHDGTLAIGAVLNEPGRGGGDGSISMQGTAVDGTMPAGAGATTGNTRDLGVNLTNDHPISFTYNSALASADGELRDPAAVAHLGVRPTDNPTLPLDPNGSGDGLMQCTTCHDPHIREAGSFNKFLRVNRFQVNPATGGTFSESSDQICLACHDKLGAAWATSAHADDLVADESYKAGAATMRQFDQGLQVWQAGCLNCHNPHTTEGARRLLREGTDAIGGLTTPKAAGGSAIEETCYQCHRTAATSIVEGGTGVVPDILSDFQLARHMPITTAEQAASTEVHDILDADFTETRANLGFGNINNRHAECTDCHNPHRLMRNSLFNGLGTDRRTHEIGGALADGSDGNLASGVLRGTFGVEPVYSGVSFFDLPTGYNIKQGDGGTGADTAVTSNWVTREYQICLKCHSDFAYNDDNVYPVGTTRPQLGSPGTPPPNSRETGTYTRYTNQAREFQAPDTHSGFPATGGAAGGAAPAWDANNNRSWHPVMEPTGRIGRAGAFRAPFNNPGTQTMYCSDCHGSNTPNGQIPPSGDAPWGPHGSSNDFVLKGTWNTASGSGQGNTLCFNCHDQAAYTGNATTGFRTDEGDGHEIHSDRGKLSNIRCNWCHTAVPHGWKNMAFLINLNDVGPEVGEVPGTQVAISQTSSFSRGPYYRNAKLKIRNFRNNADWAETDCGTSSAGGGPLIAASNGSTNNTTGAGRDWMRDMCDNPP